MKLIIKNGFTLATGMFWQIPDEGKRSINLRKLSRDTRQNMFCYVKSINTWGFCHKEELQKIKRVASMGQFIIEASKLSTAYANSIICFKFKNIGEIDEGEVLEHDLYGYIVLVNGTICPEDGEYVAKIEMVRQSVYEKATKHDIETLYLPVEVSGQFFNIFEILDDAYNNEELLKRVMFNLSETQLQNLEEFIEQNLSDNIDYSRITHDLTEIDINSLRRLIKDPMFSKQLKSHKEKNLRYLIPNIIVLPYTSDEIYWQKDKFKKNYSRAILLPISSKVLGQYKMIVGLGLVFIAGYLIYNYFIKKEAVAIKSSVKAVAIKPTAVDSYKLIKACLMENDKYFRDLGQWTLSSIKCNSLGSTFAFTSGTDTTLADFNKLIGHSGKNVRYANKIGTYMEIYRIKSHNSPFRVPPETIINNLQQAVINYGIKVTLPQNNLAKSKNSKLSKVTILSQQSPVFLYNHNVLNNIRLSQINMNFDNSNGLYNWVMQGEF